MLIPVLLFLVCVLMDNFYNVLHYSIWLNEGFTTHLQNLGVQHTKNNDSAVMDRFVLKGTQAALEKGRTKLVHFICLTKLETYHISKYYEMFLFFSFLIQN